MADRDGKVEIRPATVEDTDLLLEWANDPTTRAASFRPETIDAATHRRWLTERLASPTARLLIGTLAGTPIGQVRLERGSGGVTEVGISVARDARGRGVGRSLLSAGLEAARRDPDLDPRTFVARVRETNEASIGLFEGAGFTLRERTVCDGAPCLVYELAAR